MTSTLSEIAVDCADPARLARFWCQVLGYEVRDEEAGFVSIGSPQAPVTMGFARVPEAKTVKNRVHLDLKPSDGDQEAEVRRLLELGATRADVGQGSDVSWVVMADPEGNEFCVLAGQRAVM